MNPNYFSNPSTNQKTMENLNAQQPNSTRKRKPRNRKRHPIKSQDSNFSTQNQESLPKETSIQPSDLENQNFNRPEQKIDQKIENDFQRDSTKENQRNQEWTNYSSQETNSNIRKRSFSSDQEMDQNIQNRFKRKARFTCFERSNDFIPAKNGSLEEIGKNEPLQGEEMIADVQKVANERNQKEGEYRVTQPVRESNSNLATSSDQQQVINGELYLHNPFNPDVNQHSNQQKVSEQCMQEAMIGNELQSDQKKRIVIPQRKVEDFIMKIKMETQLHKFKTGNFEGDSNQTFGKRYELYYPRHSTVPRISYEITKKTIQGLRIISVNCGMNIYKKDRKKPTSVRKSKKKFYKTDDISLMRQTIKVVISFMERGYDFILLQQACDPIFQIFLAREIQKFNKREGFIYFYPQHLEKDIKELRTTTILTRHQVKMGQFEFRLKEFPEYPLYKPYLPIQAFVEFRINVNGKWENVCIFCAHLKSNRGHRTKLNKMVRIEQVKAIKKFSKNYDRFFCIGDVNIPTSTPFDDENRLAEQTFFDAIEYGISEIRGTFLYRNDARKVIPQRNDRVWLNNESALTTSVLINYHDILLEACEDLELDQIKMLQQADHDELPYITVTDHSILDIEIMFTK